ncbi:hypothetical protein VNO77_31104 [Canavalia gladiata]|uniref:Uncharacterized protein n=1 Tax=Canavalia gladiata TaxID=3824 RepID=A0AAN9KSF3_CANGL
MKTETGLEGGEIFALRIKDESSNLSQARGIKSGVLAKKSIQILAFSSHFPGTQNVVIDKERMSYLLLCFMFSKSIWSVFQTFGSFMTITLQTDFDGLLCQENVLSYHFDFRKSLDLMEDEIGSHGNAVKVNSLDELYPELLGRKWRVVHKAEELKQDDVEKQSGKKKEPRASVRRHLLEDFCKALGSEEDTEQRQGVFPRLRIRQNVGSKQISLGVEKLSGSSLEINELALPYNQMPMHVARKRLTAL